LRNRTISSISKSAEGDIGLPGRCIKKTRTLLTYCQAPCGSQKLRVWICIHRYIYVQFKLKFSTGQVAPKWTVWFKTGHLATPRGHHYCRMHSKCNARPMVTFPTAQYHPQLAGTKKRYHGYCVSDLPWVAASKHSGRESNT